LLDVTSTFVIDDLIDHPEAIPTLARWHHDQWHRVTPHLSIADRIAGFRARMNRKHVPCGFVAIMDGDIVGMACLVAHDMETRPELTPWLATVLVARSYRERGIGSSLSERVVEEAGSLGFAKLYLVTFDKVRFYARLGWTELERTTYLGLPATIMVRRIETM
jgi:GNAT superfamily N-acetyltransferase